MRYRGPAGKDIFCTVIDMNVDTVNHLNGTGARSIYGDSAKADILKAAGIESDRYLVITVPVLEDTAATARDLKPEIRILAKARFLNDRQLLRSAGVAAVVFEEENAAKALTETVEEDIRLCDEETCPVYFAEDQEKRDD